MKTLSALALSAAVALSGSPALAQTTPTDPSALPSEPAGPTPEIIARHQTVLTRTIADLQTGKPDFAAMTPQLADAVRQQQAAIQPALQQLGAVQSIAYDGVVQGALKFNVAFAGGATVWLIGIDGQGKIAALVLRGG